jgi:hypothetical protein
MHFCRLRFCVCRNFCFYVKVGVQDTKDVYGIPHIMSLTYDLCERVAGSLSIGPSKPRALLTRPGFSKKFKGPTLYKLIVVQIKLPLSCGLFFPNIPVLLKL